MNNFIKRLWYRLIFATLPFLLAAVSLTGVSATEFAFMTTTDYATGSSSVIWLDGSYTNNNDVASIHSDAVSRYYKGLVYVINRQNGDNIQVLDPSNGFSTLRQFSTGNGSNPKDIAFLSETKAYITRYETNDLWIVNPSNGNYLGSIDLSQFADSDGLCEMDQMLIKDGMLFITIQRLDRDNWWLPVGDSYVAVVDAAADTLFDTDPVTPGKQAISLSGANPFSDIQFNPYTNRLYVSCVGYWGMADAGVEIINQYTYLSEGFMLTESAAGGEINDVEIVSADKGYAIITNSSFHTELISFDPSTGTKLGTLYSPGGYVINDIEISPYSELFLADQTETNPGIRIYDTFDDTELTSDPIDVGLPPFDIAFSVPTQTGAETPLLAGLGQNYPNPFNPLTTIPFTISREETAVLAIYDVSGRRVRELLKRKFDPGAYELVWDGRDAASRPLPSGVYFIRLRAGNLIRTRKALLLR